jgi:hypothetical protein
MLYMTSARFQWRRVAGRPLLGDKDGGGGEETGKQAVIDVDVDTWYWADRDSGRTSECN